MAAAYVSHTPLCLHSGCGPHNGSAEPPHRAWLSDVETTERGAVGYQYLTTRYLPLPPHTTPFYPVSEMLRDVSEVLRETQSLPSMFPTIEAG